MEISSTASAYFKCSETASTASFLAQSCEHWCISAPMAEVEPRLQWVCLGEQRAGTPQCHLNSCFCKVYGCLCRVTLSSFLSLKKILTDIAVVGLFGEQQCHSFSPGSEAIRREAGGVLD